MSDATDTAKIVLKTEELKDMALATYKVRETVMQHEIKTLTEELRQTKERLARAVLVMKEFANEETYYVLRGEHRGVKEYDTLTVKALCQRARDFLAVMEGE